MLNASSVDTYARALATMLRTLGPMRRPNVFNILHGVSLSDDDAAEVLSYALAHGMVEADRDALCVARTSP